MSAAGQVRHEERGADQVAVEVTQFDPAELAASLAGKIQVPHAIAPVDLGREKFGRRLDVLIDEATERLGVITDLLVLLRRAGDADRLESPARLG